MLDQRCDPVQRTDASPRPIAFHYTRGTSLPPALSGATIKSRVHTRPAAARSCSFSGLFVICTDRRRTALLRRWIILQVTEHVVRCTSAFTCVLEYGVTHVSTAVTRVDLTGSTLQSAPLTKRELRRGCNVVGVGILRGRMELRRMFEEGIV